MAHLYLDRQYAAYVTSLMDAPLVEAAPLDPDDVKRVVYAIVTLGAELIGHPFYDYQEEFGGRFAESVVTNDGSELTLLQARQSGKTEVIAAIIAAMMILLPRLAEVFPEMLGQFKDGLLVGVFAPVDEQSNTLFSRIKGAFDTKNAKEVLEDEEIDDAVGKDGVKTVLLKRCKSLCRSQTAHPKANIESKTYHVIVIDEAQDADEGKVRKSIHPMRTSTRGTILKAGSASRIKGDFYRAIKNNQRRQLKQGSKQYHFEFDWRACARNNPRYALSIEDEKESLGEDSEEFLLSYCCKWLLDRGMFISEQLFEALSDRRMQIVQKHHSSVLVAGLDVARKMDSTVCTVLWVDWDHPDPRTGLLDCRVLNWLEIPGDPGGKWQSRYNEICDFLENYSVTMLGVDGQGLGDVVAEDLQGMLPNIDVHALPSNTPDQSMRWKHLMQLMQHGMIGWPGHVTAKRTRNWRRFSTQMQDLEKVYTGDGKKYLKAQAPDMADAHDDFPDSLSIATWLPKEEYMPTVQVIQENPFFKRQARGF